MIHRIEEDGWHAYYRDDGETLIMRIRLPEGGFTLNDWERLRDYLLSLARDSETGPN